MAKPQSPPSPPPVDGASAQLAPPAAGAFDEQQAQARFVKDLFERYRQPLMRYLSNLLARRVLASRDRTAIRHYLQGASWAAAKLTGQALHRANIGWSCNILITTNVR